MNKTMTYLIVFLLGEAAYFGTDLWRNEVQLHGFAKLKEAQIAKAVDEVEAKAASTLMHRSPEGLAVAQQTTSYPLAETRFPAQLAENSNVTTIAGLREFEPDVPRWSPQNRP